MMCCKFLANVELWEEDFEQCERLAVHTYYIKVCAHVWVLVPGISVSEVEDKFLGSAVGVS